MLSDEIEEFSRYGRPLSSRQYHDTIAEVGVNINKAKDERDIDVLITYEVTRPHKLREFFERKAQKLCKMYSLKQKDMNVNNAMSYAIRSIKISAEQNDEKMSLLLQRDSPNKAYLPNTKFDGVTYEKGEYNIEIFDDKIHIDAKNKAIPLSEWLNNGKE